MNKLKKYLSKNKMSMKKLAKLCKVDLSTAYRWTTDWHTPRVEYIVRIEKITKGFVRAQDWLK